MKSLGKIADRNGGENPFSGIFDIRLAKDFELGKTHRITVSGDVFNFANLLNKKWGVNYNLGNQSLLFVTGLDPGYPIIHLSCKRKCRDDKSKWNSISNTIGSTVFILKF